MAEGEPLLAASLRISDRGPDPVMSTADELPKHYVLMVPLRESDMHVLVCRRMGVCALNAK